MKTVHYKKTVGIEVTIRRPSGEIEVIDVFGKYNTMTDALFATLKSNTKDAGRGDLISYNLIEENATYEKTQGDLYDDSYTSIVNHMRAGE